MDNHSDTSEGHIHIDRIAKTAFTLLGGRGLNTWKSVKILILILTPSCYFVILYYMYEKVKDLCWGENELSKKKDDKNSLISSK
jgi:hypothetical protein